MKKEQSIPEYWLWNDTPLKTVNIDGDFSIQTKDGKKIPFISVFQDGRPIDEKTFNSID